MVDRAEPTLITHAHAAEILGVAKSNVSNYIAAGLLGSPGPSGPGLPTLGLD